MTDLCQDYAHLLLISHPSAWKRAWQPDPVFLSEDSHGQRSLAGYSPWGHKELGAGWIPGRGSKIPHATQYSQRKNNMGSPVYPSM